MFLFEHCPFLQQYAYLPLIIVVVRVQPPLYTHDIIPKQNMIILYTLYAVLPYVKPPCITYIYIYTYVHVSLPGKRHTRRHKLSYRLLVIIQWGKGILILQKCSLRIHLHHKFFIFSGDVCRRKLFFFKKAIFRECVHLSQNGHFFSKNIEKGSPQNRENKVLIRENSFFKK